MVALSIARNGLSRAAQRGAPAAEQDGRARRLARDPQREAPDSLREGDRAIIVTRVCGAAPHPLLVPPSGAFHAREGSLATALAAARAARRVRGGAAALSFVYWPCLPLGVVVLAGSFRPRVRAAFFPPRTAAPAEPAAGD